MSFAYRLYSPHSDGEGESLLAMTYLSSNTRQRKPGPSSFKPQNTLQLPLQTIIGDNVVQTRQSVRTNPGKRRFQDEEAWNLKRPRLSPQAKSLRGSSPTMPISVDDEDIVNRKESPPRYHRQSLASTRSSTYYQPTNRMGLVSDANEFNSTEKRMHVPKNSVSYPNSREIRKPDWRTQQDGNTSARAHSSIPDATIDHDGSGQRHPKASLMRKIDSTEIDLINSRPIAEHRVRPNKSNLQWSQQPQPRVSELLRQSDDVSSDELGKSDDEHRNGHNIPPAPLVSRTHRNNLDHERSHKRFKLKQFLSNIHPTILQALISIRPTDLAAFSVIDTKSTPSTSHLVESRVVNRAMHAIDSPIVVMDGPKDTRTGRTLLMGFEFLHQNEAEEFIMIVRSRSGWTKTKFFPKDR